MDVPMPGQLGYHHERITLQSLKAVELRFDDQDFDQACSA